MLPTLPLLAVLQLAAADSLAGTWQIKGDVVGNPLEEVCTLTQTGTALAGSCTNAEGTRSEVAGEVKDGKFTFRHGGEYQGTALTITYSGTVAAPKSLRGTVDVQPFGATGTFTATPGTPKP